MTHFGFLIGTRLLARKASHSFAGLGVVWWAQLHGTVQIQLQRLSCEAEHVKTVANGGTFSVTAQLSSPIERKGNRVVVGTPANERR